MGMRGQTERGKGTENVGNLGTRVVITVGRSGPPHFLSFFDPFAFFSFSFFFPCLLFDRGLQVREEQVEQQEQERRNREEPRGTGENGETSNWEG